MRRPATTLFFSLHGKKSVDGKEKCLAAFFGFAVAVSRFPKGSTGSNPVPRVPSCSRQQSVPVSPGLALEGGTCALPTPRHSERSIRRPIKMGHKYSVFLFPQGSLVKSKDFTVPCKTQKFCPVSFSERKKKAVLDPVPRVFTKYNAITRLGFSNTCSLQIFNNGWLAITG